MKITIIGAGSTYTPELIEGLMPVDEIALLDIDEGRLEILSSFCGRILKRLKSPTRLTATTDPVEAIEGADFVLHQFRPGGLEGRIQDEKIPLRYELIGQETTGMGGMACALRAMPIIRDYVELIRRHSNSAWIINFTNPAGLLSEFIINYLDYERCIGLCNCPVEFRLQASKIFKSDDIFLRYYGLNHLSWVDGVTVDGSDRTLELLDQIRLNMQNIPDLDYDQDFILSMGLLPNPYLRYYYNSRRMLDHALEESRDTGTRGEIIRTIEADLLRLYREDGRQTIPPALSQRGGFMYSRVAGELIQSLISDDRQVRIINTRNMGAISDLPHDFVMEIPVRITNAGPETIAMGRAHSATRGLITTIKSFERLTIEGYLGADENLIKQAMLVHPLGPQEQDLNNLWCELKQANNFNFQTRMEA